MGKTETQGKSRYWTLLMYPDDLPTNWVDILGETFDNGEIAISPIHDMDINKDGTHQKAHHHVVVIFKSQKTLSSISKHLAKVFGSIGKSIKGVATPQMVRQKKGILMYLTHDTEEAKKDNKFIYKKEDIIYLNGFNYDDHILSDEDKEAIERGERIHHINIVIDIIRKHNLYEYCELINHLRSNPDEHDIKEEYVTVAYNSRAIERYITSYRHYMSKDYNGVRNIYINAETGEIINMTELGIMTE